MDGAAASAIIEDEAGDKPHDGDSGNSASPPAEDTADRIFYCRACGEDFREEAAYLEHQQQHPQESIQCSPEEMIDKPKKSVNDYYCIECKKSFNGHIALLNHKRWHANHSDDSVKKFPCEECGKVFMTLTFYHRHQRLVHSDETAAKSFLHQVCQLQKKAFECKDCGLKFSRASALHSHQLHHTDVFRETEKEAPVHASLPPQPNTVETVRKEAERNLAESEKALSVSVAEEDAHVYVTDEDMEGYEPGDFNVQVISASESEDEPVQDLKPDLELLCESDQEVRDDGDAGVSTSHLVSKSPMDLKIVEIDFEQPDERCAPVASEAENQTTGERFDSSLRVHSMWHGVGERKQQTQEYNPKKTLLGPKIYHCERCEKGFWSLGAFSAHKQSQTQCTDLRLGKGGTGSLRSVNGHQRVKVACPVCGRKFRHKGIMALHMRKHENGNHKCELCSRSFRLVSSLLRHQVVHSDQLLPPPSKSFQHQVEQLKKNTYSCPDCGKLFSRAKARQFHMKSHGYETGPSSPRSSVALEDLQCATIHAKGYKSVAKAKLSLSSRKPKEDEPSKGPFHCSDCGRRFISNSALGSHKRWHKDKKCSRASLKDDLKSSGHKAEDGPFYCHKCWKPFFNRGVLHCHQAFNPQCRTKTVTHDDSALSGESECNQTFEHGSLLDARYENEHRNTADLQAPKRVDVNSNGSGSTSSTVKPKAHYCPLCPMTFTQARRLRAHQWQAHSKRIKSNKKALVRIKTEPVTASSELTPRNGNRVAEVADPPAGRGRKKIRSDPPFVKFISCLDCGEQCRSLGVLLDHKRVCRDIKHETKREVQHPESMAEVSQPLSRLSEHTAKCLFKCDNCGKAFQTEEQLGAHKTKAKSRPYCCALCCSGFWTENQLQQHLAWHDEVRCRLPNEVRLRLSAAMTSGPLKPGVPSAVTGGTSALSSDGQSQSSHKCQHCGKAFLSPAALQKHEGQHCNNDLYHCSICPRTFGDIQDLIVNQCSITCQDCGLKFTNWDVFQTHLHQHALEDEEEEAARLGDDTSPAAELDSRKVGDADGSDLSRLLQTHPSGFTHGADGATGSAPTQLNMHACSICGKVYKYLVSFRKHLRLHKISMPKAPESSDQNLVKYQCPECEMPCINQTRLLEHLRVHRSFALKPPRCGKCNKVFSMKSWLAHVDVHKQNPSWCLSCTTGFEDEQLRDEHVQHHNQMEYKCDICLKSFGQSEQLRTHYKCHTGVKPFQCTFCGKSFSHPRYLYSHRKKHLGVDVGSSGIKISANIAEEQAIETRLLEEQEMDTSPGVLDCGEPVHHGTISKPPESAGSVHSETEWPQTVKEENVRSEHKDWDWECVECDMGFDEMAELHLHYIKHATGELPMPEYV
ncbi:Zinc finger protein 91 [Liparis tanakae]|uniref:Zinc finger protein 91 n=1 Tax=Liparis tanakae TaxID=230148 RepID=A0A4Z2IFZ8_9TELE|nr:Zinc finger protein 91 [Liparis tanakae]